MEWLRAKLWKWLRPKEFDSTFLAAIQALDYIANDATERVAAEVNSMFFKLPGKKQVPVKEVLRLLLNRLELTVHTIPDANGELTPVIRKKKRSKS